MSPHVSITVIALKTLTLLLGGLITFLSYRAYRRTGSQSLGALALGFAIVTLGALLAGVSDLLVDTVSLQQTLLVESALTAAGFAVIVYSLYTTD